MRRSILTFIFKGGPTPLNIILDELQAKAILKEWVSSGCHKVFSGTSADGVHWAVNGSEVGGVYVQDHEVALRAHQEAQKMARQGQPSEPPNWGSSPLFKGSSN